MARRPTASAASEDLNPASAAEAAAAAADPREKIVEALFALLEEKAWGEIALYEVAERAGVTLAELRGLSPSKGAILAGFVRKIDLEVLSHDTKDMADEPARERLFDVLMRRFEALAPYRGALAKIRDGLMLDPLGAAAMNQAAVSSMQWMLAAAGIREAGPMGTARAQALVLVFGRVFQTFLGDDAAGLPRTMKALDEELRKAERWAQRGNDLERLAAPLKGVLERVFGRSSRRRAPGDDDVASAA